MTVKLFKLKNLVANGKARGKTVRCFETEDGTLVPRDPSQPLDVAKLRFKRQDATEVKS